LLYSAKFILICIALYFAFDRFHLSLLSFANWKQAAILGYARCLPGCATEKYCWELVVMDIAPPPIFRSHYISFAQFVE